MADSAWSRLRENVTGIVALIVTGTWLAALLSGQGWWLPFMLFGYIVIVPVVAILFGDADDVAEWWDDETAPETVDVETADAEPEPLQTLRDRYARGELSDAEFDRKLDRLLETETIDEVSEYRRSSEPLIEDDVE
ncbi:SHOCT domain-containing protein [Natronomonas sp.]|uniref:SHOCT domain-containing protein n=1 Tax=Natronomonas sp. TaxID=2184060 RepID=UPI003974B898